MKSAERYFYFTLINGIRIVFKPSDSVVTHMGLFINTGSRDEAKSEHGMAHFIEHVVFKGTKTRKSIDIYNGIEDVGGELNAFTTKEDTCIHASFLNSYFESSAELMADVLFNSVFPAHELKKEKEIIIDEIFYYKDIPEETIFEDFESLVFNEHALGRSILGTSESVRSFSRKDVNTFICRNYDAEKIVISIVGNHNEKQIFKTLKKYFEDGSFDSVDKSNRLPVEDYKPRTKTFRKKIFQNHWVMGNVAYSYHDKRKLGLTLLNNILGGPASNALLNLSIREKHGLTYNIESNYMPYFDTGIFSIYVSMDADVSDQVFSLVQKELKILTSKKINQTQLFKAKQQLKGNLALAFESRNAEMLSIGKTFLVFDKVDTIAQIYKKIDKINAEELLEIANEIFDMNKFTQVIYKSNGSYRAEDN
jgi:predicted Zn-dependent peptidase